MSRFLKEHAFELSMTVFVLLMVSPLLILGARVWWEGLVAVLTLPWAELWS